MVFVDWVSMLALTQFVVNQPIFSMVISTMEHLAQDINDFPTAKLSLSVLARMVSTWGGPDVVPQKAGNLTGESNKPKLEGFDQFMITRLSPLGWAMPINPNFDSNDAQGKQVLGEAAALQKAIYNKTGEDYVQYLRNIQLSGIGMDVTQMENYLNALCSMDLKGFQQYFKVFRFSHMFTCHSWLTTI